MLYISEIGMHMFLFFQRDTVQVAVLDPHKVDMAVADDGTDEALFFLLHEKGQEVVDLGHVDLAFVVPAYQHLKGEADCMCSSMKNAGAHPIHLAFIAQSCLGSAQA